MKTYDLKELFDHLDTARAIAGAEFGRLCNNNQYIDACVFQSIRDSITQNMQLLKTYAVLQTYADCKTESEEQA